MLKENEIELLRNFTVELEEVCKKNLVPVYEIKKQSESLLKNFNLITQKLNGDPKTEVFRWKQILIGQLEEINKHVEVFSPWFLLPTAPSKFTDIISLNENFTWIELLKTVQELQIVINCKQSENNTPDEKHWLELFQTALTKSNQQANILIKATENLAQQCNELADMEWDFLYDNASHLFTIGYNVQEHIKDISYYDLLASEVRLCIFICIAQGKLPQESWFALGRLLTNVDGNPILLSWSGSMFEYLMPLLVMPTYENTLLDQTYKAAVKWQIEYGKKKQGCPGEFQNQDTI